MGAKLTGWAAPKGGVGVPGSNVGTSVSVGTDNKTAAMDGAVGEATPGERRLKIRIAPQIANIARKATKPTPASTSVENNRRNGVGEGRVAGLFSLTAGFRAFCFTARRACNPSAKRSRSDSASIPKNTA